MMLSASLASAAPPATLHLAGRDRVDYDLGHDGDAGDTHRFAMTRRQMLALTAVTAAVVASAGGWYLHTVHAARERGRRWLCERGNMVQISLAVASYASAHDGQFSWPPA